jgi:hypothetical protein
MLGGCGGPQPPTGEPGGAPQNAGRISTARTQAHLAQTLVGPNVAVEFAYVTNSGYYTSSGNVSAMRSTRPPAR